MRIRPTADPLRIGDLTLETLAADSGDPHGAVSAPFDEFAIVVCTKDEPPARLAAVIQGIPRACEVIAISASADAASEREALDATTSPVHFVRQDCPDLAGRLGDLGLDDLLRDGPDGSRRLAPGKAEAMLVGVLCAAALGRRLVGFVDADNHDPATVPEYAALFALGMARRKTGRAMVRLRWKGKRGPGKNRRDWGRASRVTNAALNRLLRDHTGAPDGAIVTGNAGEFALTLESALHAEWTTGYGAESHLLLQCLETALTGENEPMAREVFQIETLREHLHTQKPEAHIRRIIRESLVPVAASPLAGDALRAKIRRILDEPDDDARREDFVRYPSIASRGKTGPLIGSLAEYLRMANAPARR
ncbi:MAG: hypothetical protein KDM91_06075 [Verrucomicrobiae bacterium]|nr:hypothetical protein [Verrucomicrobiae bacterium]MCP5540712.1 hypothetical protein [Akkermansiaceae bacterium]